MIHRKKEAGNTRENDRGTTKEIARARMEGRANSMDWIFRHDAKDTK